MNPIQKACDEIRSMAPTNWWAAHGQHVEQVIGEAVRNSDYRAGSEIDLDEQELDDMERECNQLRSAFRDATTDNKRLLDKIHDLESAIKETVTQRLDHICWLDVYQKLAKLVGVEFDPLLLDPSDMLENCARFIQSMRLGCPYKPDQVTQYIETLEKRLAVAEECFSKIRELSLRGFEIDKVAKEFLENPA